MDYGLCKMLFASVDIPKIRTALDNATKLAMRPLAWCGSDSLDESVL